MARDFKSTVDAGDVQAGAPAERSEREITLENLAKNGTGARKGDVIAPTIETATEQQLDVGVLELEKFMQQMLEIDLAPAQDLDKEPSHAWVAVGGVGGFLERGRMHTLPRFLVEVLARCRTGGVHQTEVVKPDGSRGYSEKMFHAMAYPFTVVEDPAGAAGRAWLKAILRERTL